MVIYDASLASHDAASMFFEMANTNHVEYKCKSGSMLKLRQDRAVQNCTGGIIWETAFLLGTFMEVIYSGRLEL